MRVRQTMRAASWLLVASACIAPLVAALPQAPRPVAPPRRRRWAPAVRRVLRSSGRVAAWSAVALACGLFVTLAVGPYSGSYRIVTVLSGSMAPRMPVGSMVVVTPLAPERVRVGDVITYQAPLNDHRVVTHRVIQVIRHGQHPIVRTKGDANAGADPWEATLATSPAWRVRTAVPGIGYGVAWLRQPVLRHVLVQVVPALLLVVWLVHIWLPSTAASPRLSRGRVLTAG